MILSSYNIIPFYVSDNSSFSQWKLGLNWDAVTRQKMLVLNIIDCLYIYNKWATSSENGPKRSCDIIVSVTYYVI